MDMPTRQRPTTESPRCPINVAARRSGLTAHVIRAWERRYGAITPNRSTTARRLYSDWEVQRLVLLRQAVQLGHRISEVANLPMEELHALVGRDQLPGVEASPCIPYPHSKLVEVAISAAAALDSRAFLQALLQATRTLTVPNLFEDFIEPLMIEIGKRWQTGSLRVANEHFASAHLRTFLGDLLTSSNVEPTGPCVIVSTPFGQVHELGAVMSAITALQAGWETIYLGPSLPPEEIAHAAQTRKARAVALSVCHPQSDPRMGPFLSTLRNLLPSSVQIFVGGNAAASYIDAINASRVSGPTALRDFRVALAGLNRIEPRYDGAE
ncbi:MAG: transcriptional regulator [Panacagrimonas sp.]|nr:transcriptional regulator [Panacagrimonas sp.]